MVERDVLLNPNQKLICAQCNKPIIGQIVTAMGKTWHPEHFVCTACGKPLTGTKFTHRENKPYCEDDFMKLFSERCAKCNEPIKEKMISALGKFWHEDHFVCTKCGKKLVGQPFSEQGGAPYCQKDYIEAFSERCAGCNKPIADTALVALGKHWHHNCFKCKKCGKPIAEQMFQVVNGDPICSKCS